MPIPDPSNLDLTTTPAGTKTSVETVLQQKYNSAIDWAQYAATQLQDVLGNLNTALSDSELKVALVTLKTTLEGIPAYEVTGNVTPYISQGPVTFTPAGPYVAPDAQEYGTFNETPPEIAFPAATGDIPVSPYVAPSIPPVAPVLATLETPVSVDRGNLDGEEPTFLDVPALAVVTTPDLPTFLNIPDVVTIISPDDPTLLPIPAPLEAVMPADPTLSDFADTGDVSGQLESYHTAFMNAVADAYTDAGFLVERTMTAFNGVTFPGIASISYPEIVDITYATAQTQQDTLALMTEKSDAVADAILTRLNSQLATTIDTVTTQFAARGFDMPPGAMAEKITEANTQMQYALADATAQIGREIVSSATQILGNTIQAHGQIETANLQARTTLATEKFRGDVQAAIEGNKTLAQLAAEQGRADVQISVEEGKSRVSLHTAQIQADANIATTNIQASSQIRQAKMQMISQALGSAFQAYQAFFDRGLKYVMDQANVSLETFKAKVQAQLTLIDANKGYIQATAQYNDAVTSVNTSRQQVNLGLLGVNKEQITATSTVNAAKEAQFSGQMKVNSDILGVNREQVMATNTVNAGLQEQFADKMKVLLSLMSQDITIGTNAAAMNKAKAETHLSELEIITGGDRAQLATITGQVDINSKVRQKDIVEAQYTAEKLRGHIDTIIAKYKLVQQANEGKFNVYDNTSRGKMLDIQGEIELLKGQVIAGEYNIKDAYNLFTSMLEIEKLKQVDGEQQVKRAAILADLGRMATQIDIEYAGKELLAELEVARSLSQAHSQMIASSLNGVSASVSEGWSASSSSSTSTSTTDEYGGANVYDANGNPTGYEHVGESDPL